VGSYHEILAPALRRLDNSDIRDTVYPESPAAQGLANS
jgi:hypothetical protein